MNQANQASRCFHLDGHGQGGKAFADAQPFSCRQIRQPGPAMGKVVHRLERATQGPSPSHEVVISANRVKPRTAKPIEHLVGLGPPVDKISDRKKPVSCRVKTNRLEGRLQGVESAVDVAHGEVPAMAVHRKPDDRGTHGY